MSYIYHSTNMTFHLEHPMLSTTGKKKGKIKFRNAEEAKKHRELADSWNKLQAKWDSAAKSRKTRNNSQSWNYDLSVPTERSTKHIPSLNTGLAVAAKTEPKVYTGTKMLGIGQLHKSNAVPVFSSDDAAAIAKMRR